MLLVARVFAHNGGMSTKASTLKPTRRYPSADIPMSAIRRYVRQVVEKFQPEKVILFGSYARGDQREGSDVDLLVVMPAWNEIRKASRISYELEALFDVSRSVRVSGRNEGRTKLLRPTRRRITDFAVSKTIRPGLTSRGRCANMELIPQTTLGLSQCLAGSLSDRRERK